MARTSRLHFLATVDTSLDLEQLLVVLCLKARCCVEVITCIRFGALVSTWNTGTPQDQEILKYIAV
jgi:hypothetical protein